MRGTGYPNQYARRLREQAQLLNGLADQIEQLEVLPNEAELEHAEAMRRWKERGGMRFGPPPVP